MLEDTVTASLAIHFSYSSIELDNISSKTSQYTLILEKKKTVSSGWTWCHNTNLYVFASFTNVQRRTTHGEGHVQRKKTKRALARQLVKLCNYLIQQS